jgi:hypothetical protein
MDVFTIVMVCFTSALSGACIALGIFQAVTGRLIFRGYPRSSLWTPGEIKVSGWSWAISGMAGVGVALIGGLIFEAHVIPVYWVGSPWGIVTANPLGLVLLATLLFQVLIGWHNKRRSRISRTFAAGRRANARSGESKP